MAEAKVVETWVGRAEAMEAETGEATAEVMAVVRAAARVEARARAKAAMAEATEAGRGW